MPVTFTKAKRGWIDPKPKFLVAQDSDDSNQTECSKCGDSFSKKRLALGYSVCLACSTEVPKLANAAMHKQAYTYVSDATMLAENPYSTHK